MTVASLLLSECAIEAAILTLVGYDVVEEQVTRFTDLNAYQSPPLTVTNLGTLSCA
jgi:hypothetical protein